jgi:hypothetical protein
MVSVTLLENAPVMPALNTTVPPLADETPEIFTLTVGVLTPAGLLTRIRHGDGDHERNRASAAVLLLICSSTSMVLPPRLVNRAAIIDSRAPFEAGCVSGGADDVEYFALLLPSTCLTRGRDCQGACRLFGNRNYSVQPITFGRKVTTIPRGQQAERCVSRTLVAK